MSNKLRNIKERVLYLAENMEVTKQKFFAVIGMTYGNFTGSKKDRPLNSDAIENILRNYPLTNAEWLITGEGEMLKEDKAKTTSPGVDEKDHYIIDLQKKHIQKLEEEIQQLKKEQKPSYGYHNVAEPDS